MAVADPIASLQAAVMVCEMTMAYDAEAERDCTVMLLMVLVMVIDYGPETAPVNLVVWTAPTSRSRT